MSAWNKLAAGEHEEDDARDLPDDFDYEPEQSTPIRTVQLDGLVLLKMIKHCSENVPEVVTGQLLGLDVDEKLEVTHCVPSPDDEGIDEHQMEMMKNLRDVNVDSNTVGWYQSALLGSWLNSQIIESQYEYQKEIPNSVVVVFDPFRTARGRLALKAYRLTNEFMELYASKDLSHVGFTKYNVESNNIFEEIPIKVHNSHLVHGFLYELREKKSMSCDSDRLNLSAGPFLEKTLDILSTCVDDYASEQSKFQFVQRLIARQKAQAALSRDEDGEAANTKITQQPSRLETFLLANQLSNYCDQIQSSASLAFNKLYVTEALAKQNPPERK